MRSAESYRVQRAEPGGAHAYQRVHSVEDPPWLSAKETGVRRSQRLSHAAETLLRYTGVSNLLHLPESGQVGVFTGRVWVYR